MTSERAESGWHWLLIVSPLPLFTTGSLYNFPIAVMAVLGVRALVRHRREFAADPGVRFVLLMFLGLWVPQVLALPDAVWLTQSAYTALVYLAFPLGALYVVRAFGTDDQWRRFSLATAVIVTIWGFDVIAPAIGLVEWPWRPDDPRLIDGALFGRYNLAYLAGALSPVVFETVRRYGRRHPWLLVVPAVLCVVVLLSGQRVGWLMLLLGGLAYGLHLIVTARPDPRWVAGVAVAAVLGAGLVYWQHEGVRTEVEITAGFFEEDVEAIDLATSYRLDIWETGVSVARANWLNGIGTRSFRQAYDEYADEDDYWLQEDRAGAYHAHLFALEVAAETGLFGLLGYAFVLWVLWRRLRRSPPDRYPWVWPLGIAVGVALFPLDAHTGLYTFRWSAISWWLIGLTAAAVSHPDARADPDFLGRVRKEARR